MTRPVTTAELLLQQIADSNQEIVDLLRQGQGRSGGDERPASDAPSPASGTASQGGRRPAKKSTTPRGKGREVRGD